jgi:hypothetical protein
MTNNVNTDWGKKISMDNTNDSDCQGTRHAHNVTASLPMLFNKTDRYLPSYLRDMVNPTLKSDQTAPLVMEQTDTVCLLICRSRKDSFS